jgi:hypothetical protein
MCGDGIKLLLYTINFFGGRGLEVNTYVSMPTPGSIALK